MYLFIAFSVYIQQFKLDFHRAVSLFFFFRGVYIKFSKIAISVVKSLCFKNQDFHFRYHPKPTLNLFLCCFVLSMPAYCSFCFVVRSIHLLLKNLEYFIPRLCSLIDSFSRRKLLPNQFR